MTNPISWVDAGRNLTYAEAQGLAAQLGGRLLVFTYDPAVFGALADVANREEIPVFIDGSSTRPNPTTASHLLVEFFDPATVRGLAGDDVFLGGPGLGRTLRAGAGNDVYAGGGGGGRIYLGAGDDRLYLGSTVDGPPWTSDTESQGADLYDGPGRDRITADRAVIHAAVDGDDDIFYAAARVSYAAVTGDLTIVDHVATGGGIGADILGREDVEHESTATVVEVVGGSGNDTISGFRRLQGGKGDDVLKPIAYAEGGLGNDTLIALSAERVELRAEGGDDRLIFYTAAKATGGAGWDEFIFKTWSSVTLNDWSPGEWLDLSALSVLTPGELFASGYLQVARQGGYTQLLYDEDGGGDDLSNFLTFKGVFSQAQIVSSIRTAPAEPLTLDDAYFSTPIPVEGFPSSDNIVLNLSVTAFGPLTKTLKINWSDDDAPPLAASFVAGGDFAFSQALTSGRDQSVVFTLSQPGTQIIGSLAILGAASQGVERVSVATDGAQSNGESQQPQISSGGGYVVFTDSVVDLDTNNSWTRPQIFLKDLSTGQVERVSSDAQGVMGNEASHQPQVSADGRYVVFSSFANNLTADPYDDFAHVFRKDMSTGAILNLSVGLNGVAANQDSFRPNISDGGRYVVFSSYASNLTAVDTHYISNIFLVDTATQTRTLISTSLDGGLANEGSYEPSVSDDGRFVVFESFASNLVAGDTNDAYDIFLTDTATATTIRVSTNAVGEQANGASVSVSLSGDGRYALFSSVASNLVDGDTNSLQDIFLKDLHTGFIVLVSTGLDGASANDFSANGSISSNGRYAVFESSASNLVAGDDNDQYDAFRKDLQTGETVLVSINRAGKASGGAFQLSVSDTGLVTYGSILSDAVADDTNELADIFLVAPDDISTRTGSGQADALLGGAFRDQLEGGGGRDLLRGGAGQDRLDGGDGDDELEGGAGADQLIGGPGSDLFILASPGDGVDQLLDFGADDRIVIFTANFPGNLAPGHALVAQTSSADAGDNLFAAAADPFALILNANAAVLYDTDNGTLWYDPDGQGQGQVQAVALAGLTGAPVLTPDQFWLV